MSVCGPVNKPLPNHSKVVDLHEYREQLDRGKEDEAVAAGLLEQTSDADLIAERDRTDATAGLVLPTLFDGRGSDPGGLAA